MAFENAGQEPGIQVWRIEDFEAVVYDNIGNFHVGDSYIVLKTSSKASKLSWNLHFWLGAESTQDEYGTAAIKAVELDDQLGGVPVQHREVQDHESSLFLSYFKKGIKYLPGGVKSGFQHVDPEADAVQRLFIVQGLKRNIKVKQVDFCLSSLNKSDAFVLDGGKEQNIFVYMPSGVSSMEKFKATQVANDIRDEDHAGNSEVIIIDAFSEQEEKFFEALGGGSSDVIPEASDEIADEDRPVKLYKVASNGGDVEIIEIFERPLNQDLLNQDDCFILDSGNRNGIFVWIGKDSSKDERIESMKSAEGFLVKNELPKWTKVERVVQGAETTMFKQYFKIWKESEESAYVGLGRVYPMESIAEWNVGDLHAENRRKLAKSAGSAIGFMPDDSNGQKEIFRIEDFEMVPLDESKYGMFFGGDSYVIKYSYEKDGETPAYIIYFWQGSQSSQDEKATSAISAVKLDDELNGKATQIRVTQGCESRHFIKLFHGKMVVFAGGRASGFKNVHDHDTYDEDGTRLFRIRGTGPEDIRAEQIGEFSSSLNSEDVFILETPSQTWIWTGEASDTQELDAAQGIVELVSPGRNHEVIQEGSEPDEFWNGLGGKGEYSKTIHNMDKPILEPRLFQCLELNGGRFRALEIDDFDQKDLIPDSVLILDSGDEIYIWVGNEASDSDKENSLKLAKKYLATDPTDRDESNTLIFTIKGGQEPTSFTCIFPEWN